MEIRLHGRGGQGGVTCAKLLAHAYAALGRSVQAFGDYGGERAGAPVRAYVRVADGPIASRNKIVTPDHVLVLDPTLLGPAAVAGLKPGGVLLVSTAAPAEALSVRFPAFRIATVDATAVARRHGIGTRSLVIVNTTVAGAAARLFDLPLEVLLESCRALGLERDEPAAREAYETVQSSAARDAQARPSDAPVASDGPAWAQGLGGPVVDVTELREAARLHVPTGQWRAQRPRHVTLTAPCNAACPAGNDVVGFVQALARSDAAAAAAIVARSNPLPGVCGRVCPAPCMTACNRSALDEAVQIRGLERWVADHAPSAPVEPLRPSARRRFAVVGGGPAGLAASFVLGRAGHEVALFDANAQLGGLLVTGIPRFRLPRDVLNKEIDRILVKGVTAYLLSPVDHERLEALLGSYDGLVLAMGLGAAIELAVPGRQLDGIEQGLDFLHRVNVRGDCRMRGGVVVLGGGNTAIDCARTALRLGADRVTIVYRRSRAEMPAIAAEVEQALAEGVELLELRSPVGFMGEELVREVELVRVELGSPDASGRREPLPTGERSRIACDSVLLAVGQRAEPTLFPPGWEPRDGSVIVHGRPAAVALAGDLATGAGTVCHAIGDGRRAAGKLLLAVGAELDEPLATWVGAGAVGAALRPPVPASQLRLGDFERCAQRAIELEDASERRRSFREVERGLPTDDEARRCVSCGHCTHCDRCLWFCPEGVVRRSPSGGYEIDDRYCKGCGICAAECPRAGLVMEAE